VDDPGLSGPPVPPEQGPSELATPAAGSAELAEPSAPSVDLGRYRVLQVISILFIAIGLLVPIAVVLLNTGLLSSSSTADVERVIGPALLLLAGVLLLLIGLVMNVVRSLIVRAPLPPSRYRGPAIFVLLLLAVIIASIVAIPAVAGSEATLGLSLLLLTSTQIGLLAVIGGLVVIPKTLAGVRLLPPAHLGRSILLGLGLSVPAWVGATLLSAIVTVLLGAFGFKETPGPAEQVVQQGDPTVVLVAFLVVAPIAEELFFRGVVYNAWEREWGPRVALYGSAALFAAIHTSLFALAPIFLLGLTLALVYRATRSLPASMALHAGFNTISVIIAFLVRLNVLKIPI
jgi:membrane protease YdiL (CAAX protease family)